MPAQPLPQAAAAARAAELWALATASATSVDSAARRRVTDEEQSRLAKSSRLCRLLPRWSEGTAETVVLERAPAQATRINRWSRQVQPHS